MFEPVSSMILIDKFVVPIAKFYMNEEYVVAFVGRTVHGVK